MAQQLAIIVLVDIANALHSRTLDGNVYLFDNMKFQGSEGEGTGNLVTAVRGSYWSDGSQAGEQVLNWLTASLGSIPPTVPRNYLADRAWHSDQQALSELAALASNAAGPAAEVTAGLGRVQRFIGRRSRTARRGSHLASHKILDVTGHVVADDTTQAHNFPAPVITDITGQAVDEKIIYPAEYGSPDMVSDGWYWSATVDTSRPGTYGYTIGIQLHELAQRDGEYLWEPVNLSCETSIKVTTEPMRNAFTKRGVGLLPIPAPAQSL
jgi:hypothetical protein